MAENYLFFDSTPTDERWYKASDFAKYFGKALSTGLLHEDNIPGFAIRVEGGNLNVIISPGEAILKGHLYENTSDLTLTHDAAELIDDRIDRVVLRLDLTTAQRNIKLHVKKGVTGPDPQPPQLQRDNYIYELSLAQVRIRASTVQLFESDIKDERLDNDVCGLVFSLISKQKLADIAYGQYTLTATQGQTNFDIPMINFDKFRDGLLVFVNREKVEYDGYYIKDQRTVVFNVPLNAGDVVEFQVTQSVVEPKEDFDAIAANIGVSGATGTLVGENVQTALEQLSFNENVLDYIKEDKDHEGIFRTVKLMHNDTLLVKQTLVLDEASNLYKTMIVEEYVDGIVARTKTYSIGYDAQKQVTSKRLVSVIG